MAERLYTQVDLLSLFRHIERAIVKSDKFKVVAGPEFKMSRRGCAFVVKAKLVGNRKRPTNISGSGDDPWTAAENLIATL